MTGELFINEKDAWITWGINMGDKFLENLLTPAPLKPFIENKSRSEHGKQVLISKAKVDERDVSLVIILEGETQSEYLSRYKSFLEELYKGRVNIRVPVLGETYKLTYQSSPTKMGNRGLKCGKFSLKFNEPNPMDRIV